MPNCVCWQLPGLVELKDICEVHLAIAYPTVDRVLGGHAAKVEK